MAYSSPVPDMEIDTLHRQDELKRYATYRLLEWGFPPASISWITGCDEAWVEALRDEEVDAPGQQ